MIDCVIELLRIDRLVAFKAAVHAEFKRPADVTFTLQLTPWVAMRYTLQANSIGPNKKTPPKRGC